MLYDYLFLCSGLVNVLAFLYGLIKMVTKSIYRKHGQKDTCVETTTTGSMTSSRTHTTTKAIINILSSSVLVGIAIYITVMNNVCFRPFVADDRSLTLAMTLLFTVSVFNMVLTLLTETVNLRNIHEVPTYMVTALVAVAVLIREEGSVVGVICLYMFGSIFSDEVLNLTFISMEKSRRQRSRWVHICHLSMHVLCNFLFPVTIFVASTWFSERNLFQMGTSSIVIFAFAATFFVLCNAWRLTHAWRQIAKVTGNKSLIDTKAESEVWRPNNISKTIVPMLNKGLIKTSAPVPSYVYSNELIIKESGSYLIVDDIETDVKPDDENITMGTMYTSHSGGPFEAVDLDAIF